MPIGPNGEWLAFDRSGTGWAKVVSPDLPGLMFVRITREAQPSGAPRRVPRFSICEMQCELDRSGINSAVIRRLPLERISATVNRPSHRASIERCIAVVLVGLMIPRPQDDWQVDPPEPLSHIDLRMVDIQQSGRRPDTFYADFAERFAYQASVSNKPAHDIANANVIPVSTVHRWAKEARRRGLLSTYGNRGGAQ